MNLSVNLAVREEVAAAHALLAAILGGAIANVNHPDDNPSTGARPAAEVFTQQQTPVLPPAQPDPAAIFGGAVASTPLPGSTALPATAVPGQALGLPSNGGTSVAPVVAAPPPQAFVTPEGAMQGLPTSTPSVTLDKNGLPWDDRIHAGTKTQNKDGSWKAKKGVDAALVTSVEAELRARVGNAQPAALPLPGALPTQPQPSLPQALPGAHTAALPGQFNPAQAMPGAPIASPSEPTTFEQLMMRCTGAMTAGILAPTALQNVCVQLGLGSAVTLQANPQFVPNVWAQLKATTPGLQ